MAFNLPLEQEQGASESQQTEWTNHPTVLPSGQDFSGEQSERSNPPIATPEIETHRPSRPKQTDQTSTENRLRPAPDVINRIIWDSSFDSQDYTIVYEDRFNGRLEVNLESWKKDLTDEEFIPQHRILYIKRKSDGEIVWDKRRRIDKVFYSGNSAFSWLEFLS